MVKDYLTFSICQLSCLSWLVSPYLFASKKFPKIRPMAAVADWSCVIPCAIWERGWGEDTNIGHEGHHISNRQATINNFDGTHKTDHDITKVPNENHKWHHNTWDKLWLPHRFIEFIIKPLESLTAFLSGIVTRYDCLTCVDFFNITINISQNFLVGAWKGVVRSPW